MATPHVTGVVALLLSSEPNLTPVEVKNRLITTSKPLAGLKSKVTSRGVVDAFLALTNQVAPPDLNDPDNWLNFSSLTISTAQNANQSWEVEIEGARQIALLFEKFKTETKFDTVSFYDRAGKKIGEITGDLGDTWSPIIDGDYVKIRFTSDDSVNNYGFDLFKAAYR
jgi:hypothetical protein